MSKRKKGRKEGRKGWREGGREGDRPGADQRFLEGPDGVGGASAETEVFLVGHTSIFFQTTSWAVRERAAEGVLDVCCPVQEPLARVAIEMKLNENFSSSMNQTRVKRPVATRGWWLLTWAAQGRLACTPLSSHAVPLDRSSVRGALPPEPGLQGQPPGWW